MQFAIARCGKCKRDYEHYIEAGAFIPCPKCKQMNPVVAASGHVTGRCDNCGRPLDDHKKGHCP